MIRRWLALTYYLYALRLAALSHFYFNPLYIQLWGTRHADNRSGIALVIHYNARAFLSGCHPCRKSQRQTHHLNCAKAKRC
nr:hypothetical protein [uncultured Kingella sp.]